MPNIVFVLLPKVRFLMLWKIYPQKIFRSRAHGSASVCVLSLPKATAIFKSADISKNKLVLPTAKLLGCFHFCTVTWHSMVNDALSRLVPTVAVDQSPVNIAVAGKGSSMKLFATTARNSQSATAGMFILFLSCIDSMFMLFVRSIAKHDYHGFSQCSRGHTSENIFWRQSPRPHFLPLHLLICLRTWQPGSFHCCSTLFAICSVEID